MENKGDVYSCQACGSQQLNEAGNCCGEGREKLCSCDSGKAESSCSCSQS